jgi:acetylornithine deacetylase
MLNAHVDVVPPGDLLAWEGADPFSGRVTRNKVEGRSACDMKAGLVASLWAVRGLTELKVPLRGDLVLATAVGEEDGGLGTYALLRRGPPGHCRMVGRSVRIGHHRRRLPYHLDSSTLPR